MRPSIKYLNFLLDGLSAKFDEVGFNSIKDRNHKFRIIKETRRKLSEKIINNSIDENYMIETLENAFNKSFDEYITYSEFIQSKRSEKINEIVNS